VRIIAEHKLPLGIARLFELARETYKGSEAEKKFARGVNYQDSIRAFFRERLEFYLKDQLGYKYDVVNAVLAAGADDVVDAVARAEAVSNVRGSADFESISVAFKRIKNILRQANEGGKRVGSEFDSGAFHDEAEKELGALIPEIARGVNSFREEQNYSRALAEISRIRPAVDTFFDKVMVMVEDEDLRANRLALLQTLLQEFSTIADFSEIVTEGKA
jgi:glycyl-tRNA synthetase beta chain